MSETWLLDDFEAGLRQLEAALAGPIKSDLERAGCIQYFEFTFELAWKRIRMKSSELGQPDCLSPKACLKQAFMNGWVGNEGAWLTMLDARNRMSHTYRAKDALKVFESLSGFLPEFNRLLDAEGVVKKWGNSAAVRIPASVLDAAHLELDQAVDVREERGRIVIEPKRRKEFTLAELVDGITADNVHATIDTGAPAGREAW